MVTYLKNVLYKIDDRANKNLIEIACLSTDEKPTANIVAGSTAIETDTGDFYIYDGSTWNKMCTIKED